MFMLPQEVEVWYIIPSLRKEYAKVLTKDCGLSYEKVGKILGISKAAVAQYLSDKRANKVKLSSDVMQRIKDSSLRVSKKPGSWPAEAQGLLSYMKTTRSSCNVYKEYNKEIIEYCNADPLY